MKTTYLMNILAALGFLTGCQTEYHTPHTIVIDRIDDPLAELEVIAGSRFVSQIRKNTKALGHTVAYRHCIRHVSPQRYMQLQKALLKNKKLWGIDKITPVQTCPASATAQCARVATSDYYYSTSPQLLERLKAQCQTDGTWFAVRSKHWANTSLSYSGYTISH